MWRGMRIGKADSMTCCCWWVIDRASDRGAAAANPPARAAPTFLPETLSARAGLAIASSEQSGTRPTPPPPSPGPDLVRRGGHTRQTCRQTLTYVMGRHHHHDLPQGLGVSDYSVIGYSGSFGWVHGMSRSMKMSDAIRNRADLPGPAAPNHRCRRRSLGAVYRTLRAMPTRHRARPARRKDCSVLSQVRIVVGQLVESMLSVVGIRVGTEEPSYTARPLIDGVEIRRYGPRIAAETTVAADEEAARSAGFRRLAGYIFGGNHQDRRIAMTASVAEQVDQRTSQKIAMTAPVAQSLGGEEGWIIRFVMPAKWTMDSLPTPDDERVRLITLPAESVAVLRFTGDRGPDAIAARTKQLLETLRAVGFAPVGEPTTWLYDPPWTIPFRRRNEIAIPVDE